MSAAIRRRRARALFALGATAGLLALLVVADRTLGADPGTRHARYASPVIEDAMARLQETASIEVVVADAEYKIVRTRGGWRMDTADGYPVRLDRLAGLLEGLTTLNWGEARTRDPRKFDRLALGDPREGGTGALVTLRGENGQAISQFIAGRRDSGLYARRVEDEVAFRVSGDLPPLYARDAWMDFAVIQLQSETIGTVELTDGTGRQLRLSRPVGAGPRDFALAAGMDGFRLSSRLAASAPALALARFSPLDVKPASALSTQPLARHVTITHDGLEVVASAYREADGLFVTLRAVEAGEGAARAAAINDRADGWAFELSDYDWADFAPPLASIAQPVAAPTAVDQPGP